MAISRMDIGSSGKSYVPQKTKLAPKITPKPISIKNEGAKGSAVTLNRNPLKNTNFSVNNNPKGATVFEIRDNTAGRIKGGKPVGEWATRIDNPHSNTNYNHINTNDKLYPTNKVVEALNHKPVPNTVYTAAKNFKTIEKGVKVGGRALGAVAVVLDAKDIYDSYKSDGNKIGGNTIKTTSGVAGSWAGAAAGGEAGAYGGAAIGTLVCPGIGTAIGGLLGGLVGGIAGSFAGRSAGESIAMAAYHGR